jgi:phosphatidylserine/phosphatidylglycerophosphate/cardiolipin synthase-like enzyme
MAGVYYSLDARIELVRRAREALDVQYYLIQNDRTGRLFMCSLRDAALRGAARHQSKRKNLRQDRTVTCSNLVCLNCALDTLVSMLASVTSY